VNDEQNIVVENELLRRGFTSIPNYIFGLPISSNAKLIYMALLSYAWTNQSCYPGLAKLCSDVSLSDKPVTKAIEELAASQLLEVKRRGQGKTNIYIIKNFDSTERGSKPSDSRIGDSPTLGSEKFRFKKRNSSETKTGSSPKPEPENLRWNKDTEEKDSNEKHTHTTARARRTDGVRVDSKFTLEECQRYAAHLQATGQGINNPGGYATTIYRTGEADSLIEKFVNPPALRTQVVDASLCPDCKGSGWWYPKGERNGVAKCKHEQLKSLAAAS